MKKTPAEITPDTAALADKIITWLNRFHEKCPDIPIDVLWADLKHDIEAITTSKQ